VAGCDQSSDPAVDVPSSVTLNVGFGLTTGAASSGISEFTRGLTLDSLLSFSNTGRPQARLAENWVVSPDGLSIRVTLRPNVTFRSGKPVNASIVRDVLLRDLPELAGSIYEDIKEINTIGDLAIVFLLRRRSTLILESLELLITDGGNPPTGTGPFYLTSDTGEDVVLAANPDYFAGQPTIDRIIFKPYNSVRAAWADLLRGEVDMLYQIGQDALESLQTSSFVKVFTYPRPYAYMLMLNVRRPALRDPGFRRNLNAAIDRAALMSSVFNGRGIPATGPVSPNHWAFESDFPGFSFSPAIVAKDGRRIHLKCVFSERSLERLALTIQRQLSAIGVDLELEFLPAKEALANVEKGEFDTFLGDFALGPTMLRLYRLWYSGQTLNWSGFSSVDVDAALDSIRHASTDDEYRQGVAEFHEAILDNPPAVFLAWSERTRAVSTRFEVAVEPGRDITSTLRLWKPANGLSLASRN
jgi:peptide/nickel transport system substrate-binding protein